MNLYAHEQYMRRVNGDMKRADEIYRTIRELYGWEIPWNKAYYMAIKDKLLSKEEKALVKEFHPVINNV